MVEEGEEEENEKERGEEEKEEEEEKGEEKETVLEVVLGVGQHLEEGLNELLVLQRMAGSNVSISVSGGREDHQPPLSSSPS